MTRSILILSLAASALTLSAKSQDVPTLIAAPSVGFQLPQIGGEWSYAISASQTVIVGYDGDSSGGTATSSNISGDFAYASSSLTHPTSIVYSGGYLGSESSELPSSSFQNLALSQEFRGHHWDVIASDTVSYLPQSPVGGLSGVPGIGDLGVVPITIGATFGPGILTNYDTRVSNITGVTVSRELTGSTSVQASGNYAIQRFLDSNGEDYSGFNSNQTEGSAGITHRINARNSFGVNYLYSKFTYVSQPFSFTSNGVNFDYTYRWTHKLTFDVSLGPQFSDSTTFSSTATTLAASLALTYLGERSSAALSYVRGTNAGSGVVEGALSDSVGFTAQRRLNQVWNVAGSANYTHTQSLPTLVFQAFDVSSEVVAGQISRGFGRSFSAFASYTLEKQNTSGSSLTSLTFTGLQQVFGFGVTYSPATHHLGRP